MYRAAKLLGRSAGKSAIRSFPLQRKTVVQKITEEIGV